METLKFRKVRNVKSPVRGTSKSAGIDLFIPEDFNTVVLNAKSDVLIPSGLIFQIPAGYMLMGADKSGVATSHRALRMNNMPIKNGSMPSTLIIGAKIVDEDYPGETHIHLINVGSEDVILRPGDKVAQFILVPVSYAELEEVEEVVIDGERVGGFGSTND